VVVVLVAVAAVLAAVAAAELAVGCNQPELAAPGVPLVAKLPWDGEHRRRRDPDIETVAQEVHLLLLLPDRQVPRRDLLVPSDGEDTAATCCRLVLQV
jgi:hypothetical protein